MKEYWSFSDKLIFKKGEPFLELPSAVNKILVLDNALVILLNYSIVIGNRNVFCYGFSKELKWQVPPPEEFHDQNDFTGIYINDNALYAYNRNGVEYLLDKESGKILFSQLIK